MTPEDLDRVGRVYVSYRGTALSVAEAEQFRRDFADRDAPLTERAIKAAAEEHGWVSLAGVAKAYASLRIDLAVPASPASTRGAGNPEGTLGWPTAKGQPTTAYLLGIAFFGMFDPADGRHCAERYVLGKYVLQEHADRVLAAIRLADRPKIRWLAAKGVVEEIEQEIGAWDRCTAESFVAAATQQQVAASSAPAAIGEREVGEEG